MNMHHDWFIHDTNLVPRGHDPFGQWQGLRPLARSNYPGSQRLSFNIIFFQLEICDAKRWSKRRVRRKRKPLVATVANLTFMLAQHLTAVKDVIFFWPITKGDRIDNLLTGPGGSVLQYLEINYFVGRGEERSAFAVYTSCRTSRVLFSFLKGTNYFFGT